MSKPAPAFAGSMAESYERYLVPILFAPYARDMAARLPDRADASVLELACGTGVVTNSLLARLSPAASIHATDVSRTMVEYAQANARPDGRLKWQIADAQSLPFEDARFDAIVCQFGATFFADKLQAFREARRALRPGGKLLFNVWTEMPENPVFHSVELALRALLPDEPTPIMPTPSSMADPAPVTALLKEAGFDSVRCHRVEFPVRGFDPLDVLLGFAYGTPISTLLRERELPIEQAQRVMLPLIAQHLGDPLNTSMAAWVIEAD